MKKIVYPEHVSLMLELKTFFFVKGGSVSQVDEVINKDGIKESKTFVLPKTRIANGNNDSDFHEIYEREFKKSEIQDTPENQEYFRNFLIEKIESKLIEYKASAKKKQLLKTVMLCDKFISFLKKLNDPNIKIPDIRDNSRKKDQAQELLCVLSGQWLNGKKIMNEKDYKMVIEGVFHLIDHDKIKPIKNKIETKAPMQFVRRLFRELNTLLFGRTIKDSFIEFLHTYFKCFEEPERKTTKNHYREYRNGIYENDYKKVMETINK